MISEIIQIRLLEWDSSLKAGFRELNLFQKPYLNLPVTAQLAFTC